MANSTEKAPLDNHPLSTPNPDPTAATTAALLREITGSKEIGEILVRYTRDIVETSARGDRELMSARVGHVEKLVDRHPSLVKEAVDAAVKNVDEKLKVQDRQFDNVQVQFKERDTRQEQTTKDSSKAIDAAFAAADKASVKIETGFTKQIEEQGKRIDTVSKAIEDKVSDVKELINDQKDRITVLESRTQGISLQKVEATRHTASAGVIAGIVFGSLGFVLGLGSLIVVIIKH